ncbi:MAG: NAD(P)H-dependent flavin oxidoreductase [Candidatus Berkiella sp.]
MKPRPFTHKLGIRYPIIQAPMSGGSTTPELVAAVANAGGLGSFAGGYLKPNAITDAIHHIRQQTTRPFAVNLFIQSKPQAKPSEIDKARHAISNCCPELNIHISPVLAPFVPDFTDQMQVIIDEKVPVFSFAFGILEQEWLTKLRRNKTIIIGTATTLKEASALQDNGVDFIVLQGLEAGGHRGTFFGHDENEHYSLHELLSQTLANIKTPLIAAGGIMNDNGIKDVLARGAVAAQLGTAFLTCHESGITKEYKKALLEQQQDNTVLTKAFSGKLARSINNAFIERMKNTTAILPYPIQNALTTSMRTKAKELGNIDFMSLYAGQRAFACQDVSVRELMERLVRE